MTTDPYRFEDQPVEGHEQDHSHEGYEQEPRLRDLPLTLWNLPRFLLLGLIRVYQMSFSRLLPANTCRFYPSCSHYGYQAIYKYGAVKGSVMAGWRVVRCNPLNPGGFDPVP
jgi:putative membrane protein insertion efficiency factor